MIIIFSYKEINIPFVILSDDAWNRATFDLIALAAVRSATVINLLIIPREE